MFIVARESERENESDGLFAVHTVHCVVDSVQMGVVGVCLHRVRDKEWPLGLQMEIVQIGRLKTDPSVVAEQWLHWYPPPREFG